MVHLIAASLPVFNVWCSHLSLSHEVCLWSVSVQEDSVDSCDPPDVEEATAFPSEEDDEIHEWRQEFPEQPRRAISGIHTNLGHPQNSTLATMISDAGGSEEIIKSATRYPCSVHKRMSRPRLRRPVSVPRTRQFNDTHWLMCVSGITRAVRGSVRHHRSRSFVERGAYVRSMVETRVHNGCLMT